MLRKVEHQTFLKPGDKKDTLFAFLICSKYNNIDHYEVDMHIKRFTLVIKCNTENIFTLFELNTQNEI